MRLVTANHSSYPRVGEGAEAQRLRRAFAARERGELDDAGYLEVARSYSAEIMREQADAGCDLVTDGQVHHYDLVSHPGARLGGTSWGGLHRFFDTNHLVRRPEITGALTGVPGVTDDYSAATEAAPAPVKAVMTGPYTMARHSVLTASSPYEDVPSLTMAYAERAAEDLAALSRTGCEWVQIEEPSVLRHGDDAILVRDALVTALAERGNLRVSLVTYFGDATLVYAELVKMPVDMLGFDCCYSPEITDMLVSQGVDRPVALGLADGRNTKTDDTTAMARTIERVAEALASRGIDEMHVQPSCGLEYLPRDRAQRKLSGLRAAVDAASKVGAGT